MMFSRGGILVWGIPVSSVLFFARGQGLCQQVKAGLCDREYDDILHAAIALVWLELTDGRSRRQEARVGSYRRRGAGSAQYRYRYDHLRFPSCW